MHKSGFRCIAVQKTFMERRTYATGKKWWFSENTHISVTSPQISLEDYIKSDTTEDGWIHYMVGDLQVSAWYVFRRPYLQVDGV